MMMFEVIKNAGVPAHPYAKYPFETMDVSDAFDAPKEERVRVSAAASAWAKRGNRTVKFTVRKLDENTIRCVRIA